MELYQILLLAFLSSMAIFMHILSCALYNNWFPMVNLVAYLLAPLPILAYLSCGRGDSLLDDSVSKNAQHWAEFGSSVGLSVVVGLPIVMCVAPAAAEPTSSPGRESGGRHARAGRYNNRVIEQGAMLMDLAGFLLLISTIALAVVFHRQGDGESAFG